MIWAGSGSPMGSFFPDDGIGDGADALSAGRCQCGYGAHRSAALGSLKLDKEAVALAEEKAHGSKIDLVAEVKKAYMGRPPRTGIPTRAGGELCQCAGQL